jgi:hypothetical protein
MLAVMGYTDYKVDDMTGDENDNREATIETN